MRPTCSDPVSVIISGHPHGGHTSRSDQWTILGHFRISREAPKSGPGAVPMVGIICSCFRILSVGTQIRHNLIFAVSACSEIPPPLLKFETVPVLSPARTLGYWTSRQSIAQPKGSGIILRGCFHHASRGLHRRRGDITGTHPGHKIGIYRSVDLPVPGNVCESSQRKGT